MVRLKIGILGHRLIGIQYLFHVQQGRLGHMRGDDISIRLPVFGFEHSQFGKPFLVV